MAKRGKLKVPDGVRETASDPAARAAAAAAGVAGGALAAAKLARDRAARRRQELRRFRLDGDEELAAGIRRIARGQIDVAKEQLEGADGDELGGAIHNARKSFKRQRALLRLVRDELGDARYGRENAAFRDHGRRLAGVRDAKVLVETLDGLVARFAEEIPEDAFAGLRSALVTEERAAHAEAKGDQAAIVDTVTGLGQARNRVATWRLASDDGYGALAPGFERIYRRGRRALRAARKKPDAEHLHELRKRAKDLWHAAQVARPVTPKRMKKLASRAHRLSDLVGEHHDLAVLV